MNMHTMPVFVVFLFAVAVVAKAEWTVPANPSPPLILRQAEENIDNGNHSEALRQLEWLFDHSLEVKPSFLGTRASVVLSEWNRLGKVYEPALKALKVRRENVQKSLLRAARSEVLDAETLRNASMEFLDLSNIDRTLSAESDTASLFRDLSRAAPVLARRVYPLAQDALIEAEEYALCDRFLDPLQFYASTLGIYRANIQKAVNSESTEFRQMMTESAKEDLIRSTVELIALLSIADRDNEAEILAEHLGSKLEGSDFKPIIDAARRGEFPREPN